MLDLLEGILSEFSGRQSLAEPWLSCERSGLRTIRPQAPAEYWKAKRLELRKLGLCGCGSPLSANTRKRHVALPSRCESCRKRRLKHAP